MTNLARRCALSGLAALSFALAACQPDTPPMTPTEAKQIEALTARMTTRCVGRYLIDLPDKFVLNNQSRTEIEGVTITVTPMEQWMFNDRLKAYRERLDRTRLPLSGHAQLRSATPIDGGLVFDRAQSDASSDRSSRALELYSWRDGYQILASTEATDLTFPEDADDPIAKQLKTDVSEKLAQLMGVFSRLRGRRDNEIPAEQGVCFANGFLKGPPTDEEWIDMYHHWSEVEDVYFTYHYMSNIGPQSTTLPQRGSAIEAELKESNGRTLRKGPRGDAGVTFDEWLVQRETRAGGMRYRFTLEANSTEGIAGKPLFIHNFSSGVRHPRPEPTLEEVAVLKPITQASLGAAPSIALWDTVTRTLRPRPGAF